MDASTPRTGSLEALSSFGTTADTLWTRIAPAGRPEVRRTILFVGTEHRAGTSTAAACAAVGLARHLRAQVMLIEIGLGDSTLASLLNVPEGPGLYELLCGSSSPKQCTVEFGLDGLAAVTAGRGALPAGELASERAQNVFEELGAGRDFVIIDAPPILTHPELHPILWHVDEAVLVFEADRTQRDRAQELMECVTQAGVKVLGSVLNRARASVFS